MLVLALRIQRATGVEKVGQIFGIWRRLAAGEIRQVRAHARFPELNGGLVNVVAGEALTLTPTARLVRSETGTPHLLRVTCGTTQVGINQLAARRDAGYVLGKCLGLILVEVRREGAELFVRQHDATPRKGHGAEKTEVKNGPAFH